MYVWTEKASRRELPPLVFRLLVVPGPRHPLFLITSVSSRSELTDSQVADLSRARWGIEVFYRHLKQTFGRRKLRSGAAQNARVELEWSLAGLWAMGLYALREVLAQGVTPQRLSMARSIAAFRRTARDDLHPAAPRGTLQHLLRQAVFDGYHRRNKASRDYPRKKKEQPAGPPVIQLASRQQIQLARRIKESLKKG